MSALDALIPMPDSCREPTQIYACAVEQFDCDMCYVMHYTSRPFPSLHLLRIRQLKVAFQETWSLCTGGERPAAAADNVESFERF